MLTWFLSNHCILTLVPNVENQKKNTEVCMASFLSLNRRISTHFDGTHLKLSIRAYFEVRFHSMLPKYENSKNRFYEVDH